MSNTRKSLVNKASIVLFHIVYRFGEIIHWEVNRTKRHRCILWLSAKQVEFETMPEMDRVTHLSSETSFLFAIHLSECGVRNEELFGIP
mmetsp:Transcript_6375/g.15471  ORF Transcript_6375/g.15471 Transcript_6375/m.15471 type:complete len:89 (+) Transcript_6375:89-355(+)